MAILSSVKESILSATRILVVSHVNPDGDALGSLLGLGWALRRLGKDRVLACPTAPLPASLVFLPGSDEVVSSPLGPFDLVIVLDSSAPDRMAAIQAPAILGGARLLNIDHHITNVMYGAVNWVEPAAASTAEMVFGLVGALGVAMDAQIALCLLTGIVTDTLGFRTSSTTSNTLRIAAGLMDAGASLPDVVDEAYNAKPIGVARLWGEALRHLHTERGLAWTAVTRAMMDEYGAPEDEVKGLVSFLRGTSGTDIAVLFVENGNGAVKVEFRSSRRADVSGVATTLGGGGHRQASGCTIPGPLAAAEARVLPHVRQVLGSLAPAS
jgi:bifunctional oligoribonuclease and PAP phosphatase NrnA